MKSLLIPAFLLLSVYSISAQEKEKTDETALEAVIIKNRKKVIEKKVDRMIYHVENSAASTGGNALDALKSAPLVRVQNESVSIAGKGEVLIMVDERLQRMPESELAAFLKTIPSDNIKSIEIITAPPAKYEAEGNSGIINIRLKKAGNNSWNASAGANYTQRYFAGSSLQGTFGYNRDRLSLQASVYTEQQKLRSFSESRTFYPKELWIMNQTGTEKNKNTGLSLGLDYKITEKWTSGIKYLGSFNSETSSSSPLTSRINYQTMNPESFIASDVVASNKPDTHTFNWFSTTISRSRSTPTSVTRP